jgi:pimeloyl-ACP methyl ester carboxylesterase
MVAMIDIGRGPAIVVVPGIQGRWEWMKPALEALAARHRVLSFSLADEPGSATTIDPSLGFDTYLAQIDDLLDRAGIEHAAICGVSYGALIAVRYAAERSQRTDGLILVSPLPPSWQPDERLTRYCSAPRAYFPLFCLQAFGRFVSELNATFDAATERLGFAAYHAGTIFRAPMSPVRASQRVQLARGIDLAGDCGRVRCPTLVVTGEADLDRVVPPRMSIEYLNYIAHAEAVTLPRTGHLGLVTRPAAFAALVSTFSTAHA